VALCRASPYRLMKPSTVPSWKEGVGGEEGATERGDRGSAGSRAARGEGGAARVEGGDDGAAAGTGPGTGKGRGAPVATAATYITRPRARDREAGRRVLFFRVEKTATRAERLLQQTADVMVFDKNAGRMGRQGRSVCGCEAAHIVRLLLVRFRVCDVAGQ